MRSIKSYPQTSTNIRLYHLTDINQQFALDGHMRVTNLILVAEIIEIGISILPNITIQIGITASGKRETKLTGKLGIECSLQA